MSLSEKGSYQSVTIIGHATGDAEVRSAGSANLVNVTIATPALWESKQVNGIMNTKFWDCEIWRSWEYASNIKKGDKVFVEGHVITKTWQNADGGNMRRDVLQADNISILRSKNETSSSQSTDHYAPAPQHQAGDDDLPF